MAPAAVLAPLVPAEGQGRRVRVGRRVQTNCCIFSLHWQLLTVRAVRDSYTRALRDSYTRASLATRHGCHSSASVHSRAWPRPDMAAPSNGSDLRQVPHWQS